MKSLSEALRAVEGLIGSNFVFPLLGIDPVVVGLFDSNLEFCSTSFTWTPTNILII